MENDAQTGPEAWDDQAEEGPEIVLAGRFSLYEDGSPVSVSLNGSVSLTAWSSKKGRRIAVPVVDSQFELGIIRGKDGIQAVAGSEVLKELDAEVEYFTMVVPEVDGYDDLQLRAEDASEDFLFQQRLEVGDLDATVELQRAGAVILEVEVHFVGRTLDTVTHPKGQLAPLLASKETSPFSLRRVGRAALSKDATLLVGAPGFAWKRIKMNLSTS